MTTVILATAKLNLARYISIIYNFSLNLQVDISSSNPQAQDGVDEALALQLFNSQPSSIGQIQAREADVQALSELTRALDKKVWPVNSQSIHMWYVSVLNSQSSIQF